MHFEPDTTHGGTGFDAGLAFGVAPCLAADLTIPKTFVPGSPATAADCEPELSATATVVNSKQNRILGTCQAGQTVLSVTAEGALVCDTTLNSRVTTIEAGLVP